MTTDHVQVHLGGRFIEPAHATVSLLDRGYLLGDGVFATMRGYDGVCFRPAHHLDEIARGAAMFGFEVPSPLDEIARLADEAARRTNVSNAYVRVTLTHGPEDVGPTLSIIARPMDVPAEDAYTRGIVAVTVKPRRIPPACIDGTIKTTSYAVQVLARREVRERNAQEGVQLTIDGALACGTMSTLFIVRGRELLTPSLESGCRAGVTRAAVLELAPQLGFTVREQRLEPAALLLADEAFFASTRVECLPIKRVDDHPIGRGDFERTHALRAALVALVRSDTERRRTQLSRANTDESSR